jgi:hypothetical protein
VLGESPAVNVVEQSTTTHKNFGGFSTSLNSP